MKDAITVPVLVSHYARTLCVALACICFQQLSAIEIERVLYHVDVERYVWLCLSVACGAKIL